MDSRLWRVRLQGNICKFKDEDLPNRDAHLPRLLRFGLSIFFFIKKILTVISVSDIIASEDDISRGDTTANDATSNDIHYEKGGRDG